MTFSEHIVQPLEDHSISQKSFVETKYNSVPTVLSTDELGTGGFVGDQRYVLQENSLYEWDGASWNQI